MNEPRTRAWGHISILIRPHQEPVWTCALCGASGVGKEKPPTEHWQGTCAAPRPE
jgi:hypothetical protein